MTKDFQKIAVLTDDFAPLNDFLKAQNPSKLFILVDENTHEYCLPKFLFNLETDIPFEIIEIEAGEEIKTIETATQLWEILAEFKADRKSLIINLGGGVITDLGGFVASTYKRSVPFINFPTSLLAMCDASLGGKTGIDHAFLKNIVGTFALPVAVFLYPDFLETLPYRELRSGFAEMLKHGLIADETHWRDLASLKEITVEGISPLIERSMNIKSEITQKDFHEKNIRKTLNFGHTVGHAVESLFIKHGKTIPHGEAVALGMICETHLSLSENLVSEGLANEIISGVRKFFPKIDISGFSNEELLEVMQNDKKNSGEKISFSLLSGIGMSVFDHYSDLDNVKKALDFYRN